MSRTDLKVAIIVPIVLVLFFIAVYVILKRNRLLCFKNLPRSQEN